MVRDIVCGMDVDSKIAGQNRLYQDYNGTRYLFCSLACFQVFQMNPQRFINRKKSSVQTGHCELCSKAICKGDEVSELAIRGTTYKFCCPTCASVYSRKVQADIVQAFQQPSYVIERLKSCGLFKWLEEAVQRNASDLFLTVGELPLFKIYGSFKPFGKVPLRAEHLSEIIRVLIPESKQKEFSKGREVDIGLEVPGLSRFRVNVFREQHGNSVAFRPLPFKIPAFEKLGLPDVFRDFSRLRHGLILITGPAGSGKSTTLAAFIDMINQREERHIITIEDPIEYVIPNKRSLIHQREVGYHTASFSDGLRSALRENPDIIVIGELRDLESIALAVRAAETGHLVLGTLHSGRATQAITRLLDVFVAERQQQLRIQLAQSLQAVCAQRLFKRRDSQGMIVATDLLIATVAVRNIIRTNRLQELHGYMEMGKYERMHTFEQSIQDLVNKGVVDTSALREVNEGSPIPRLPTFQKTSKRLKRW